MPARRTRLPLAFIVALVVLGGVALGIGKLWQAANTVSHANGCAIGSFTLDLDQTQDASVMVGVVLTRSLPERAAVLTLAAGLQESKLRNIPAGSGDRDSVGVLQQRPSQGWGTAVQIADIHYATGKFLDALVKVEHWQTASLADTIQAVQRSADGSAYAKHEAEAQVMADALTGRTAAGVSCSFPKPTVVATPAAVATQLKTDLPVETPVTSARVIRVPGAAWATAAWLVSHANAYGIDSVTYAGQRWRRTDGWHTSSTAELDAVTATLAAAPKP